MKHFGSEVIETDVPARLDRLPWSRFHAMVVIALGVTWILDGLEVTIVGSIGPALTDHRTLGLTGEQVGMTASAYVAGTVLGALVFGWLTDTVGRRAIYGVTLGVYVLGVFGSAFSWNVDTFTLSRILTGIAVGGEYAAINSAIDEITPARLRGRVNLGVNASYWLGAAIGALASVLFTNGTIMPVGVGWRLAFAIGGVLGLPVIWLRRFVPESPRWLITHGHVETAHATVAGIEHKVVACGHCLPEVDGRLAVRPRRRFGLRLVLRTMVFDYPKRSVLVIALMLSQAFLFNAIFFTYGLVLTRFFHVAESAVGLHILPLAIANLLGPFLLGPLFDTVGRKRMIAGTYAGSGIMLAITALLFATGALTALTQTILWMAIFFAASSAASSAYLTASEIFPLETRAMAFSVFFVISQGAGGVVAPWVLGHLIGTGSAWSVASGYLWASVLMLGGAVAELVLGIDAEGKPLEQVAEIIAR